MLRCCLSTGCAVSRARGVWRMAEDHREPQERPGGLPRRVPGANGRPPGQVRRGFLPVRPARQEDTAAAPAQPDAPGQPDTPDRRTPGQPDAPRPVAAGQLPRRAPGASDIHTPPRRARRSLPPTAQAGQPAAASSPGQPDPEGASPAAAAPSPTTMASSAAKLLRAAAASNRAALTSAAAEELSALTQRRVVPLQPPNSAAAQAPAPAATPAEATVRPAIVRPAIVHPATVPPVVRTLPVARRTRSARRWQLTGMLLAIAIVALLRCHRDGDRAPSGRGP